jgi:hypothetical protein
MARQAINMKHIIPVRPFLISFLLQKDIHEPVKPETCHFRSASTVKHWNAALS